MTAGWIFKSSQALCFVFSSPTLFPLLICVGGFNTLQKGEGGKIPFWEVYVVVVVVCHAKNFN